MKKVFFFILSSMLFACQSEPQNGGNAGENLKSTVEKVVVEVEKTTSEVKSLAVEKVTFPAPDSLTITANLFHKGNDFPVIVLCHQAGSSKDEYNDIAQELWKMGYNCLALDQRSGGDRLGGNNETANLAVKKGITALSYFDAQQDMLAGIDYANQKYGKQVILVGSSYSAALALKITNQNEKVKAVASFSPGEYYKEKGKTFITDAMTGLTKPMFITSAKNEASYLEGFYKVSESEIKIHYIPEEEGIHGARALWSTTKGTEGYWEAFKGFLNQIK